MIKAPTIALADQTSGLLSLCASPLCSKLAEVTFKSMADLRALVSDKGENPGMQTLRAALASLAKRACWKL